LVQSFKSRVAVAGVVIYAAMFVAFYPPMFSTLDEDNYLTEAYVLKAGTIFYDQAGFARTFTTTYSDAGHVVGKHPPGNSLLLIPFVALGPNAAFLSGLVFHVIGWALFTRTLVRAQICGEDEAAVFGLLYLFFPLHVIQSRTLLSDLPSEVLVLAGVYGYLSGRLVLSGALWGLATLVRPTNVLVLAAFAVGWLVSRRATSTKIAGLLRLAAGSLPFGIAILLYNYYAFGGMFTVPGNLVEGSSLNLSFVPRNLTFFVASLLLVYPLMLVGPFLYRGPARIEMWLAIAGILTFHSLYFYLQTWDRPLEWIVLASRHLLPVMPFFLLCYPLVWKTARALLVKWLPERPVSLLAGSFVAAVIIAAAAAQARHYEFQAQLAHYRNLMHLHTPENAVVFGSIDAAKLLNPAWGFRDRRLLMHFDQCLAVDDPIDEAFAQARPVYVVALRREFKDPNNALRGCMAAVERSYQSEIVYQEEAPWKFSIHRLTPSRTARAVLTP
jgi:hypothetical protein